MRFRRPSIFAVGRAVLFLAVPIPLVQWWYADAFISTIRWYFMYESNTPLSRRLSTLTPQARLMNLAMLHQLEVGLQVYNVQLWSRQNLALPLRNSCFLAQTLGAFGAAGALCQRRRRRRGHCTSCDYNLQGLLRDSQGHVRCPECGSRAGKAHPVEVETTAIATHRLR